MIILGPMALLVTIFLVLLFPHDQVEQKTCLNLGLTIVQLTIAGRMALLVTLFLVLVNIFNSVTGNAPKAEGLTAVETWVQPFSFFSRR